MTHLRSPKNDPGEERNLAQGKNKIKHHPRRRRAGWLRFIHREAWQALCLYECVIDSGRRARSRIVWRAPNPTKEAILQPWRPNAGTRQWGNFGAQTRVN